MNSRLPEYAEWVLVEITDDPDFAEYYRQIDATFDRFCSDDYGRYVEIADDDSYDEPPYEEDEELDDDDPYDDDGFYDDDFDDDDLDYDY